MDYSKFVVKPLPPNVGRYRIGGNFYIVLTKKPHFLARWMSRLLLDWHWEDKVL